MDDKLDKYTKHDALEHNTVFNNSSAKINNSKLWLRNICISLSSETNSYLPESTLKSIDVYIKESTKVDRILYSEITSYIVGLSEKDRGVFLTNINKLMMHVLDDKQQVSEDTIVNDKNNFT